MVKSIQTHGVLQPLLLRRIGNFYELVAGERRWRAARQAGLETVPAILKDVNDRDALELTLIENLQREDLNAIEEAEGYQSLSEQFNLSHDDIAQRVGKARATVTNALRLLALPGEIKQMLSDVRLSAGQAKALLGVAIDEEKCFLARRAVEEGWSVRVLEKAVERLARAPRKPRAMRDDIPAAHLKDLSDKLHRHFGTSVRLVPSRTLANGKKAKGLIEIDFYSNEDLTRILDLLGLAEQG
jgi:ParB family transcriptional regulator, chromosome partitioning protein